MVLWPGLGHLDAAVLSRRRAPAALVFHDPDPLRPAFGYGKFSRLLATTRQRVTVIAHSLLAEQRLREIGYRTLMIPHPVLRAADTAQAPSCPVVRVLGQYKPVRDTDILVGLGERLVKRGIRAEIVGRGWPRLPGWDVRDEFVGEDEFDQLVRNTSAVVLPYQRYWQSGVALRALEHAVPVVGVDHGFLREVLGQGAPGLVSRDQRAQPEAWIDAIHCTLATEREYYADRLDSYAAQGRDALDAVVVSLAR